MRGKEFLEKPQLLMAMLNNLPGMAYICRMEEDWSMEFVNPGCQHLTGYPADGLIENREVTFGKLIHPDDRPKVWDHLKEALKRRHSFEIVYRITTKSGRLRWVKDMGAGVDIPGRESPVLVGFIADISHEKLAEKSSLNQAQRLEALRRIDQAILSSFDRRFTFDVLMDQVITHLGVDAASILRYDHDTNTLNYVVGRGLGGVEWEQSSVQLEDGYAGAAALERGFNLVNSIGKDPKFNARAGLFVQEGFSFYVSTPLEAKGQLKGVLEVFNRLPIEVHEEWLQFLRALAGQAAIAVDHADLFDDLQRTNDELRLAYDAALVGWSKTIERHGVDAEGHSQRVTEMTLELARAMGMGGVDLVHLRRGSLLHDIGKVCIPDKILNKSGPLTQREWKVVQKHPEYAYELLAPINHLRQSIDIPYCHHEHWDGAGYPRGLSGEQIPLSARLFSVVDVYDALLSPRPYREPWAEDRVVHYVRDQSGHQFDPAVVNAFFSLM